LYLRGDFGDAFFCPFVRPAGAAIHLTDQEQVTGPRRATPTAFEPNIRSIGLPPKKASIWLCRAVVIAHPTLAARRKLKRLDVDSLGVLEEDAIEGTTNHAPVAVLPCPKFRWITFARDFDGAHVFRFGSLQ
jgi:hypothetical protein